ncbi:MAG: rod-binding protein [Spirochaetaceae bacterium]|jgi:flagellar protein FlgJ|nr:rod-binding protein [Spirochaetaceae bacterium]
MTIESAGSLYLDEARLAPLSKRLSAQETSASFSQLLDAAEEQKDFLSTQTGQKDFLSAEKDVLSDAEKNLSGGKIEKSGKESKKPRIDKTDKLYEQCEALETFLIKNLISGMRNTVEKSGFIEEGFAGKMYEDMLYDEYAKAYSKNANFGLAELAYLELTGQRGKTPQ